MTNDTNDTPEPEADDPTPRGVTYSSSVGVSIQNLQDASDMIVNRDDPDDMIADRAILQALAVMAVLADDEDRDLLTEENFHDFLLEYSKANMGYSQYLYQRTYDHIFLGRELNAVTMYTMLQAMQTDIVARAIGVGYPAGFAGVIATASCDNADVFPAIGMTHIGDTTDTDMIEGALSESFTQHFAAGKAPLGMGVRDLLTAYREATGGAPLLVPHRTYELFIRLPLRAYSPKTMGPATAAGVIPTVMFRYLRDYDARNVMAGLPPIDQDGRDIFASEQSEGLILPIDEYLRVIRPIVEAPRDMTEDQADALAELIVDPTTDEHKKLAEELTNAFAIYATNPIVEHPRNHDDFDGEPLHTASYPVRMAYPG